MKYHKSFYPSFLLGCTICFFFACKKSPDATTPVNPNVTITSLQPTHGPANTIDTLTGINLDKLPSLDSVTVNGKKAVIINQNTGQIVIKIPSLAGTGNVDVWYNGKSITGPVFTYDSVLVVTTIAGTSQPAEINGKGINAGFYYPEGIAIDPAGNIYVADMGGSCIRKIDVDTNVTTLAGPGNLQRGFADGTGNAALFSAPVGLCIDQSGNLYVADQFNYKVRKVSPTGVVTTLAGVSYYPTPDLGGTDGPVTIATFNTPYAVACDNTGNIYVADEYNNKIRQITTGVVSSLAGGDYYHYGTQDGQGSSALFYVPNGVAADQNGNLYVIDNSTHLIRKITSTGIVTTILGPTEPGITGPYDPFSASALATDKSGNLFFSVTGGIFERTPAGDIIRYAIGGVGEADGPIPFAAFRAINGIAIDENGNLFITDNNRIRKIGWQ